ncbi:uncharacterized protein E0L32_000323 [Thyridium curvatum]|uniref:Amino acid permease/ SLC12A domain-containing protein n=1 Tax=Thyridium curvatum TaxID=1093900 RepID=A0A507BFB4_9PEZI|nr:uncharacterized protein E0L32_000323 [Thyridium curvatum]TPX15989.1 hypothetical protein E0L32_000323 [Thyridium curvatum]
MFSKSDEPKGPKDKLTPRSSGDEKNPGGLMSGMDIEAAKSKQGDLERAMSSRHLQFIAIGGTFGTGLFIGTGAALAKSGPVSLLLAYIFIATVVYSVMVSLGEMAAYMPVAGSFAVYATRFYDSSLGFALGWLYWANWAITYALELTAAGLIIQYWDSSLSIAIWIAVFWTIFTLVNFLPIRWYGEIEMWFSTLKVVTVAGFIIYAICVNAGVGDQGYIGFKYYNSPGAFNEYMVTGPVGKFVGFWAVLIGAGFSFQGAELVGVGAGETANPEKAIPSAIRWTYWGISVLFVALVFFIGINIPFDNEDLQLGTTNASASPLVIVAKLAGVPALAHIINAVLLTAVLSAANSNVYCASRILLAMAREGQAPKLFARTNRHGVPWAAVGVTSLWGLVGFLNLSASGTVVFNWLLNLIAVAGFITWALISACHIRFLRALAAQHISRDILPYKSPLQPWLSWYGLVFNVLILMTSGFTVFIDWKTADFFACYISVIVFVALWAGHKLWSRSTLVPLKSINLTSDRM